MPGIVSLCAEGDTLNRLIPAFLAQAWLNTMKSKCDLCGREFDASSVWRNKNEQFCTPCATLKMLELQYRGFPPESEDELRSLSREMENLVDKGQGKHLLPLIKKGLTMVNKMIRTRTNFPVPKIMSHLADFFSRALSSSAIWV